ncbi:hypothetical protein ABOM_007344 [Aspergillus bombycis]|uniref:Uncharacterized protein n=1 Tax=Aspergillus bombycis TaxID=109264 RepID=A0A1F7ZZ73_9EURO|nr:hypothetical protein ABOM_007344 [Aspergillus bombycis]OGM44756.1 hypothetical protein ABOM_007344 [Aspergillus bombycis]
MYALGRRCPRRQRRWAEHIFWNPHRDSGPGEWIPHAQSSQVAEQRRTVTAYHGSVDVQGESHTIIHGRLRPESTSFASSLVSECRFQGVKWKSRLPWVSILIQFRSPMPDISDPAIHAFSPQGTYSLLPIDQEKSHERHGDLSAGAERMGLSLKTSYGWSKTVNRKDTNDTKIKGMKICNTYGEPIGVKWTLEENPATQTGVPAYLRAAIRLERQEDFKYEADVKVEYEVDRKSWKERFFGARDKNDPILYKPANAPINRLPLQYDKNDLGCVDMEGLFDAAVHTIL